MKSIKTPNHPAYNLSTLWPQEVWVRGLYNSWWFCVHKPSMFIYLSMGILYSECLLRINRWINELIDKRKGIIYPECLLRMDRWVNELIDKKKRYIQNVY